MKCCVYNYKLYKMITRLRLDPMTLDLRCQASNSHATLHVTLEFKTYN